MKTPVACTVHIHRNGIIITSTATQCILIQWPALGVQRLKTQSIWTCICLYLSKIGHPCPTIRRAER